MHFTSKRLQLDKTNSSVVIVAAITTVVFVFSLVAAHALYNQSRYQSKVLSAKHKADKQLKDNVTALSQLENEYTIFDKADTNVIGGNGSPAATGDRDGNNARIVLDALPSRYDYPALISSVEKMMQARQIKIASITGTDDEINQETKSSETSPAVQTMGFSIAGDASYTSVKALIGDFESSIRPFSLKTLTLTGSDADMNVSSDVETYFQPAKNLNLTTEVVK